MLRNEKKKEPAFSKCVLWKSAINSKAFSMHNFEHAYTLKAIQSVDAGLIQAQHHGMHLVVVQIRIRIWKLSRGKLPECFFTPKLTLNPKNYLKTIQISDIKGCHDNNSFFLETQLIKLYPLKWNEMKWVQFTFNFKHVIIYLLFFLFLFFFFIKLGLNCFKQ